MSPWALCRTVLYCLEEVREEDSRTGPEGSGAAGCRHSKLVGAAIALGELHQAVADHLSPAQDEPRSQTDALAAAGILLGRCVYRSSRQMGFLREGSELASLGENGPNAPSMEALLGRVEDEIRRVSTSLPVGPLGARLPEGYAFYALYPEMYFASLYRALRSGQPRDRYVVIGIRSIGSSLAALVAGALVDQGIAANLETVRPRGYPFSRLVVAGPGLRARFHSWADNDAGFILVDEGPGLSCSSFLSVSSLLEEIGVDQQRIAILAAWQGAPGPHASPDLRARWDRAQVYHTPADQLFDGWRSLVPGMEHALRNRGDHSTLGRLQLVRDLSYGKWMDHLIPSGDAHPPVNRSAERVKLLLMTREAGGATNGTPAASEPEWSTAARGRQEVPPPQSENAPPRPATPVGPHGAQDVSYFIAKFAGLGEHGERRLERAAALAAAGFSPEALAYSYGFLIYRFVPGRPLTRHDLSPSLLRRMVDYYVFLRGAFSGSPAPRFDRLADLVLVNARKGLAVDASDFLARWQPARASIDRQRLVLLDGRPQPHKWIEVAGEGEAAFLKTDGADHAEDHTIVGEQSILWDLAGAWEEWRMSPEEGLDMLTIWERRTGDTDAAGLIDFYRVAYLAFRLGGMHYAIDAEPDERIRGVMEGERERYADRMLWLLREDAPARRIPTSGRRPRRHGDETDVPLERTTRS